ncbi:protein bicaudal C homolog 1-B-like isoform X2 [Portunus trituberculatus]|uniref:protein bicaudal C homolog 1-B-like isoform X2 n=1 Tax=Portunus trituberculatus TaxID=210409 RepID=UPI001E1CDF27|nr:protein bicaudal C homolog 1-B-like isoform X2 [Portunus trituberculatus]
MGPHDHQDEDEVGEMYSEESLSRSDSVDYLSLHALDDGTVEERFRVDRRKLEAMILGRPTDPCDHDLRLPQDADGSVLSAEAFFRKIMDETETEIKYPKFLKAGARSKKDPHVRVVGSAEAVRAASLLVRQELDPPNKVTMKMDVPWTHHSHIIGKGGNTIRPVVKKTGVSIHFPDGNKSNEIKKSNQVSINSRGEDLQGLEEARQAIRNLTPLIFTFTLSSSVQFVSVVDANMLILQVQNAYNVQVELRALEDLTLVGSVRGSEWDAARVKEATLCILQAYCNTLASQVPIQMAVEVSPQHHSYMLGRNNDNIKRIMHRTSTKIVFPDWNDPSLSPLKKSTITISGSLENVYLARQNIIGSLPLVLMFDLQPGSTVEVPELSQMMQLLDVQIVMKSCRMDGRRPVVVKGPERNADNVYEAWRMLCKVSMSAPKARIPSSYHMPDASSSSSFHSMNYLGLGQWVGGGSGGSSPFPSPTSTPAPTPLHHLSSTSLWGGLTTSTTPPPLLPHVSRPLQLDPVCHTPANLYSGSVFRNGYNNNINNILNNNNNNNNNMLGGGGMRNTGCLRNDNCILPKDLTSSGGGINLDSLVKSMKGIEVANGDLSCGSSNNSGSSLSSPAHSPRDASPDQVLGSSSSTTTTTTTTASPHFSDTSPQPHSSMDALSALLKDMDWRAPGCEKKHRERVAVAAQKMTTLSDYSSKKVEAARAMKQDVGSTPRTPTSSWSGYGFSKSMPGFMIRQKLQEVKEARQNGVGGGGGSGLEEWGEAWPQQQQQDGGGSNGMTSFSSSSSSSTPSPSVASLKYHNGLSQFALSDKCLSSLTPRPPINLSASNFMDCVLPRSRDRDTLHTTSSSASSLHSSSQGLDITSILTDLQLPQYIDVFLGQEVDLKMFLSLEDYELKELGITIFGHRKRILMAIKDLSSKSSLFLGGAAGSGLGGLDHHSPLRDSTTTTSSSTTWD